jgi:hypothetical protein
VSVTDDAITVISRVRAELNECGTPAYTAVALLPDGRSDSGAFTFARRDSAIRLAAGLRAEYPSASVYVVGRHAAGPHVRYTVRDATASTLLHRQDEIVEDEPTAIGGR